MQFLESGVEKVGQPGTNQIKKFTLVICDSCSWEGQRGACHLDFWCIVSSLAPLVLFGLLPTPKREFFAHPDFGQFFETLQRFLGVHTSIKFLTIIYTKM